MGERQSTTGARRQGRDRRRRDPPQSDHAGLGRQPAQERRPLRRLPPRQAPLPRLPHRAHHRLTDRDRRDRRRLPPPRQRPRGHHRRPLGPRRRRSDPDTPRADHQWRLRPVLDLPPRPRTPPRSRGRLRPWRHPGTRISPSNGPAPKWFQPLHACGSEFLTCGAVRGTLRQFGRFLPRFSTRISKRISDHRWTWSAGYSVERAFFRVADRSDRAPEPKPAAAVIRPSFLHERTALYTPAHGFRRASPSVTGWVPGRLVERLAFPGALVRCRRWLIMDPGGDLGGQVAQFGGVPGAREITLGVLAGG